MDKANHSFNKHERLCSRKLIEALFAGGHRSISAFPLRVVYIDKAQQPGVQVLVSVSKRRFKHAVDRNRAKRQVREAWRLHKDILLKELNENCALACAFVWLADTPVPTALVQRKMKNLLHRIAEDLTPSAPSNSLPV